MSAENSKKCSPCFATKIVLLLFLGFLVGAAWQQHHFQSPGVGEKVMNFEVPALTPEEEIKNVRLSDFEGKWKLLFFYPKDGTTVCPTELRALLADKEKFDELNVEVLPISVDSAEDHQEWEPHLTEENFAFNWLADPKGKLAKYFGIFDETNKVSYRGTILLDPENKIQTSIVYDNSIGRTNEEILRAIAALQAARENGGVCPYGWEEGDDTIPEEPEYVMEKDREESGEEESAEETAE